MSGGCDQERIIISRMQCTDPKQEYRCQDYQLGTELKPGCEKKEVLPHSSMARQKIGIQNRGMQYYHLAVYAQICSDFFGE